MTRGWMAFFVVVTIVSGCAGTAAPQRTCALPAAMAPQPPFLWEVRGPTGSVVLFGTHQAAAKADVPQAAWQLLDAAQLFVAEADEVPRLDTPDPGLREEALSLPKGQSLMKLLSDAEYFELQDRLEKPAGLVQMKPWLALDLLIKKAFTFPHPNMATAFSKHVRDRQQAREFLDTREQQIAFLDATVPIDGLRGALRDYDHLECSLTSELAAYRAGQDHTFDAEPPPSPRADHVAIAARGERWTKQIETYLGSGRRAFIAIGVSNILGAHGIAARLAADGFTVERVVAEPAPQPLSAAR